MKKYNPIYQTIAIKSEAQINLSLILDLNSVLKLENDVFFVIDSFEGQ